MSADAQDGMTMPSGVTATATKTNKTASFNNITFNAAGTYTVTVQEVVPTAAVDKRLNGILYNDTEHTVVIEVEDIDGTLTVTKVTIDGSENEVEAIETAKVDVTNTYSETKY